MSTEFIGLKVIVKLRSPPVSLQGLVADVQGQRLYLHNVTFLASGKKLKEYTVHGLEIDDIEVLKDEIEAPAAEEQGDDDIATEIEADVDGGEYEYNGGNLADAVVEGGTRSIQSPSEIHPSRSIVLRPAQVLPSNKFVDPAILSYARKPSRTSRQAPVDGAAAHHNHSTATHAASTVSQEPLVQTHRAIHHHEQTEAPSQTFDYLVFDNETHEVDQAEVVVTTDVSQSRQHSTTLGHPSAEVLARQSVDDSATNRPKQRANKKKKREDLHYLPTDDQPSSPELTLKQPHVVDASGWRQTPILENFPKTKPSVAPTTKQPRNAPPSSKKSRRQRAFEVEQAQNGWATEDATDVQDLGDFDFEGNLAAFDKRAVFEQLKEADTTADDERLVSFNRLPRPGTFGGKNLHPSEMVLEVQPTAGGMVASKDFEKTAEAVALAQQHDVVGITSRRVGSVGALVRSPKATAAAGSISSDVDEADLNGSMTSSRLLRRHVSRGSARLQQQQQQAGTVSSRKSSVIPVEEYSAASAGHHHHHHHHHHIVPTPTQQQQQQQASTTLPLRTTITTTAKPTAHPTHPSQLPSQHQSSIPFTTRIASPSTSIPLSSRPKTHGPIATEPLEPMNEVLIAEETLDLLEALARKQVVVGKEILEVVRGLRRGV